MQRGLGGFPHERLHQDGSREQGAGKRKEGKQLTILIAFDQMGYRTFKDF